MPATTSPDHSLSPRMPEFPTAADLATDPIRAPGPTLLDELDRRQDEVCRQLDALNDQIEQLVVALRSADAGPGAVAG